MALIELSDALAEVRTALLDEAFTRATASGRRRGVTVGAEHPERVEVRPVLLRGVRHVQVTERTGPVVRTRNLRVEEPVGPADVDGLDALLAMPFATWHAETAAGAVQVQVTKKGLATVGRTAAAAGPAAAGELANDRRKQHLLDPDDPLFRVLGAGGDKRRQVDAFLRQLAAALPDDVAADRPLRVVDLGCGNAYLTLAAQRWLAGRPAGARTVGVELRADLVRRSTERAAAAGVEGLTFTAGTIADADPSVELGGPPDVVLALHACDTATDDALARAVAWDAPVVLAAPCCHRDVQRQLVAAGAGTPSSSLSPAQDALVASPILRERFADVLTDSLRAAALRAQGYRVDVVEFIDSAHTPRNALLRAVRPGRADPAPAREAAQRELEELAGTWRVRPLLGQLLAATGGSAPRPRSAGS
ncbi:Methyltransferase domain-containing protein [Quadrisphaera granulorum]|uniref:Methyltransferase family protein n=1 Tax=Quadrisphaera granulorum TaxID=317664 RepID=A0A316AE09_9ACTN|nr:SAM-dependent methyltransferase [Quadrisphaera granulorum]PWJ55200.1 methyltransferase family protein [Quadrisphaera granulorum]SZE95709.1 Methyltransferase domain-containing protein [Quadrisphaera granulorum]